MLKSDLKVGASLLGVNRLRQAPAKLFLILVLTACLAFSSLFAQPESSVDTLSENEIATELEVRKQQLGLIQSLPDPANDKILILEIGSGAGQVLFLDLADASQIGSIFEVDSLLEQVAAARIQGNKEAATEAIEKFRSAVDYVQSISVNLGGQLVSMSVNYIQSDLLASDIVNNYQPGEEQAVLDVLRNLLLGVAPLKLRMLASSSFVDDLEQDIADLEAAHIALASIPETPLSGPETVIATVSVTAQPQAEITPDTLDAMGGSPQISPQSDPAVNELSQQFVANAELDSDGSSTVEPVVQNRISTEPMQVEEADFSVVAMDEEPGEEVAAVDSAIEFSADEAAPVPASLKGESVISQASGTESGYREGGLLENPVVSAPAQVIPASSTDADVTAGNFLPEVPVSVAEPAQIAQPAPEPDLTFHRGEPIFENSNYRHDLPGRWYTDYSIALYEAKVEAIWSQVQVTSLYGFSNPPEQLLAGERATIAVNIQSKGASECCNHFVEMIASVAGAGLAGFSPSNLKQDLRGTWSGIKEASEEFAVLLPPEIRTQEFEFVLRLGYGVRLRWPYKRVIQ